MMVGRIETEEIRNTYDDLGISDDESVDDLRARHQVRRLADLQSQGRSEPVLTSEEEKTANPILSTSMSQTNDVPIHTIKASLAMQVNFNQNRGDEKVLGPGRQTDASETTPKAASSATQMRKKDLGAHENIGGDSGKPSPEPATPSKNRKIYLSHENNHTPSKAG